MNERAREKEGESEREKKSRHGQKRKKKTKYECKRVSGKMKNSFDPQYAHLPAFPVTR